MRNLSIILIMLLCSFSAHATNVSGGIYQNTTWSAANSPYIITGNLVVFTDVVLTIEPGVEVLVDAGVEIEVRGRLVTSGDANNGVIIRGNTTDNTNKTYWKGIRFFGNDTQKKSHQADLNYCTISNAYTAIDMDIAYQGPYTFRNCTFTYNTYVNDDGGMNGVLFDKCTFMYNSTAISYFQFGGKVSNSFFDWNDIGVDGCDSIVNCRFYHHKIGMRPYGYTANCEITNNEIGVSAAFNSVNNTFINNLIENNDIGLEIMSYFNSHNFSNNKICGNNHYNIRLSHLVSNPNLANTCWCTTDSAAIRSKIKDGYVDVTLGLVSFMPVRNDCTSGIGSTNIPDVRPVQGYNPIPFTVYPNPAVKGEPLHIYTGDFADQITGIQVTDITGRSIQLPLQYKGNRQYTTTLENVNNGVYFLRLRLNNGEEKQVKILVQ